MHELPSTTVEKIESVNRLILKLKRVVTVLILITAAWITIDVYRKRNEVPPLDIRPTFTLGATDVAFCHPSGWDIVPLGTQSGGYRWTVSQTENQRKDAGAIIQLVFLDDAKSVESQSPLVPADGTIVSKVSHNVSGHIGSRVEWHCKLLDGRVYQHGIDISLIVGKRLVAFSCVTFGPSSEAELTDERFQKYLPTFNAVLKSLTINQK